MSSEPTRASEQGESMEAETRYDALRRCDVLRNIPAELEIREAMKAVEALGADVRLTDAMVLLSQAKNKVSDFVDGVAASPQTSQPPRDCDISKGDTQCPARFMRSHDEWLNCRYAHPHSGKHKTSYENGREWDETVPERLVWNQYDFDWASVLAASTTLNFEQEIDDLVQTIIFDVASKKDADFIVNRTKARINIIRGLDRKVYSTQTAEQFYMYKWRDYNANKIINLQLMFQFAHDYASHVAASQAEEIERLKAKYDLLNAFYSEGHLPEVREMEAILERDRTAISDAVNGLKKVINERDWLREGRGPYQWDDDRWHDEFNATAAEIRKALEPFVAIQGNIKNCPHTWEEVVRVRTLQQRLSSCEEQLKASRKTAEEFLAKLVQAEEQLKEAQQQLRESQRAHLDAID